MVNRSKAVANPGKNKALLLAEDVYDVVQVEILFGHRRVVTLLMKMKRLDVFDNVSEREISSCRTGPGSWRRSDWNWGDLAIGRKRRMEEEVDV